MIAHLQSFAVLADERAMVLLGNGDLTRRLLLQHLDDTATRLVNVATFALEHHRQRAVLRLGQLDRALCNVCAFLVEIVECRCKNA